MIKADFTYVPFREHFNLDLKGIHSEDNFELNYDLSNLLAVMLNKLLLSSELPFHLKII